MSKSLLLDLLKLLLLFGVIWVVFVIFPIFPDKSDFEISMETEDKLGEIIVDDILLKSPGFTELNNPEANKALQVISTRLINSIGLTEYDYQIRIVDNPDINAVTLPGGNIFIFKGLIQFSDQPEEVAAVLAHEIGHVEKRHVVSKLVKEFGVNLLFAIIAGGDAVMLGEVGKTAISTVFDRKQETEADQYGLELLVKSGINPKSLASFFRKVNREFGGFNENLEILMTHPHNNARIKASLEYELPPEFKEFELGIDWPAVQSSISGDHAVSK